MARSKNYFEWTIGTKATETDKAIEPNRTVEWLFVSPNYTRVGIGYGKFVRFAGAIDPDKLKEFKDYAKKTFGKATKPTKSEPTKTTDLTDTTN